MSKQSSQSRAKFSACPSCSVVVPVHNGGEVFEKCIDALLKALRPQDELIVVADGPGDGAWQYAKQLNVSVIKLERSYGPAIARNEGAKAALGDILLFIDADVTVEADCIERVMAVFAKEPTTTALIGSYDDAPAAKNFLSQYRNLFHHFVHQNGSIEASSFWAGCGAVKREVFNEVGGFDPNYDRPSIEDIELGYRLVNASHRIRLVKDLQVKHWKQWTPLKVLKTDLFNRAIPWTELLLKKRFIEKCPPDTNLNLGWLFRLSLLNSNLVLILLIAATFSHPMLILSIVFSSAFFAINAPFIHFFRKKRGNVFLVKAIFWRYLYDIYSALGLLIGIVYFGIDLAKKFLPRRPSSQTSQLVRSKINNS